MKHVEKNPLNVVTFRDCELFPMLYSASPGVELQLIHSWPPDEHTCACKLLLHLHFTF